LALAGCSLAPDYQPPPPPVAATAFKAIGAWKPAAPLDQIPRGAWWHIFADATLDRLEETLVRANPTLQAAVARHDQAQAALQVARADLFPTIAADGDSLHAQRSATTEPALSPRSYKDNLLASSLSYEIDLWGRVRNGVLSQQYQAEASAADLASVMLSLEAELAADYFSLKGLDAQQALLDQTVEAYRAAYDLTLRRHEGGAAAQVDVDQAETLWNSARTEAADTRLSREQQENAIAILTGVTPEDLSLAPAPLDSRPLVVAPGLPSTLLERRPDVAAAERRMAAANAAIGVAEAAFFPVFSLSGAAGIESAGTAQLIGLPSLMWAAGPAAAVTLFDAGRREGVSRQARATFDEAAADYRATVLVAYREVDDSLSALHHLEEQAESQDHAVEAAERALMQARTRYTGGLVTYLEVVSAENTALAARQTAINILIRRMMSSVQLVKALGGGWQADKS
jgi:NodT family efflux transporter outer membrane factor (OMF) lipoprotein